MLLSKKRIIISKSLSLGEAVLNLAMPSVLKAQAADCHIIYLGTKRTEALINCYSAIDEYFDYSDCLDPTKQEQALQQLKQLKADIFINVHNHPHIARLAKRANIPIRIGNSRCLAHWLSCNYWVNGNRKKSMLHEAQIDLNFLRPLGIATDFSHAQILQMMQDWRFADDFILPITPSADKFNLILHPLKSSRAQKLSWPIERYQALIEQLNPLTTQVFLTGSIKEGAQFHQQLAQPYSHVTDLTGQLDLAQLIYFMRTCDGLISGSTGPLHLAAALGLPTLGLFSAYKHLSPRRWRPLGKRAQVLSLKQNCQQCRRQKYVCACLHQIPSAQVQTIIQQWHRQKFAETISV